MLGKDCKCCGVWFKHSISPGFGITPAVLSNSITIILGFSMLWRSNSFSVVTKLHCNGNINHQEQIWRKCHLTSNPLVANTFDLGPNKEDLKLHSGLLFQLTASWIARQFFVSCYKTALSYETVFSCFPLHLFISNTFSLYVLDEVCSYL